MSRVTGLLLILGMVCLGCSPPEGDVEQPTEKPALNETAPAPSTNETVPPSEPVAPVEEPVEEPAEEPTQPPMEPMPAPAEETPVEPAETPAEEPMPPAENPAPPAEAATEVDVEAAVQPTPADEVEGLLKAESAAPIESPQTSQPAEAAKMEKPAETEKDTPSSGPVTTKLSAENTLIQFVGTHKGDKPDPRTGKFTKFNGEVKGAGGKIDSVTVEIETSSLETEIEKLTNHLKSPDFFDVRQHPKATFKSTKIEPGDGGTATITGDLTLLGETKSITFPAKVTVEDDVNLTAEFAIDRTEFGMDYGTDNVHEDVNMTIKVGK